jgi:hypothetical protein
VVGRHTLFLSRLAYQKTLQAWAQITTRKSNSIVTHSNTIKSAPSMSKIELKNSISADKDPVKPTSSKVKKTPSINVLKNVEASFSQPNVLKKKGQIDLFKDEVEAGTLPSIKLFQRKKQPKEIKLRPNYQR